jgi:hypothetical protein
MSNDEQHDDDVTSPDLPSGLGDREEPTNPGVGTGEAFIAVSSRAGRAMAAIQSLAESCPPLGDARRRRHLEVLAHAFGEAGDLCHDNRRVTLALIREEDEQHGGSNG